MANQDDLATLRGGTDKAPEVLSSATASDNNLSFDPLRLFIDGRELFRQQAPPGSRQGGEGDARKGEFLCFSTLRPAELDAAADSPGKAKKESSEITLTREKLKADGIDPAKPTKVSVGLLELKSSDPDFNEHALLVGAVINNPRIGLCPGAKVNLTETNSFNIKLSDYADKKDGIDKYFEDYAVGEMKLTSQRLQKHCLDSKDPSMKVFNLSISADRSEIYTDTMQGFTRHPDRNKQLIASLIGADKADKWVNLVKEANKEAGNTDYGLDAESLHAKNPELTKQLFQAIVDRADAVLDKSDRLAAAAGEYVEQTKKASDKGINIVIAAGNRNFTRMMDTLGAKLKPGAEFNMYAMSEYVVAVGAADVNKTPGNYKDDKPASFTAAGNDKYGPTVIAQGTDLPTDDPKFKLRGTSYAAPQVSAAIALMLEQNPKLTPPEIKKLLSANAHKLEGVPSTLQGAGMVDLHKAVLAARDSKSR